MDITLEKTPMKKIDLKRLEFPRLDKMKIYPAGRKKGIKNKKKRV